MAEVDDTALLESTDYDQMTVQQGKACNKGEELYRPFTSSAEDIF
jgi:hypothetical protein